MKRLQVHEIKADKHWATVYFSGGNTSQQHLRRDARKLAEISKGYCDRAVLAMFVTPKKLFIPLETCTDELGALAITNKILEEFYGRDRKG